MPRAVHVVLAGAAGVGHKAGMGLPVLDAPEEPLCQAHGLSCAACCGLFNFAERSPEALRARLQRRTARVAQAGWGADALREAARELTQEESPSLLFRAVRTCPLAGYLDPEHTRVGCLIHPRRHPAGEDLRDLGAYGDRGVCAGHLCAPHTWMQAADRELLSCAPTWRAYSMAVGETGFLKAVLAQLALERGAQVHAVELRSGAVRAAAARVLALFDAWPFADPDPRRFGGFSFAGDDAYTRSVPSLARYIPLLTRHEAQALDALGTLAADETAARAAVAAWRQTLAPLVAAITPGA